MLNEIISKVEVWVAMVALNLTIVGLSSLAEKRCVIGLEYGRYLLDKYKICGLVRLYYLLVFVAVVDVVSIVAIWVSFIPVVTIAIFGLLSFSTGIVIFFLFAYVLRVHDGVKRQIYKDEVQGLYNNNNKACNFYGDILVGMRNGDRTSKKLSSNVLRFFDQYNGDTIGAFCELFGPESVVYDRYSLPSGGESHDYAVYENERDTGVRHISWEFFQMFRYSELQERWILEILRLFNGGYADRFPRLRIYNVARVLGQINRVGFSEGLYRYKFLDYLFPYVRDALKLDGDHCVDNKRRIDLEKYLFEQLAIFMSDTMKNHPGEPYRESVEKVLRGLLLPGAYVGTLSHGERVSILTLNGKAEYSDMLDVIEKDVHEIAVVFDFGNVLVDWCPDYLYKSLASYDETEYRLFKEKVMTPAWIAEVDASERMDEIIEAKVRDFPMFEKNIRLFKDKWTDMVQGEIAGMCKLLTDLRNAGYHLYGLSNWCKETFTLCRKKYEVLRLIDDYLISGGLYHTDGQKCPPKPGLGIYRLFLERFRLEAGKCLFIDDNQDNVDAARKVGMNAFRFVEADQVRRCLL